MAKKPTNSAGAARLHEFPVHNGPGPLMKELYRRAETRLHHWQKNKRSPAGAPESDPGTARLLHELEVRQIELEMQNAELQKARSGLAAALEKDTDLYDFAPVGYLTLDEEAVIREVNLAGASLLGTVRSALVGQRFGSFVSTADLPAFGAFLRRVFASQVRQCCELTLRAGARPPVEVELEAVVFESGQACRVVVKDITESKAAAAKIRQLNDELEKRVGERTAQLQAANQELEAFSYSVSHDLRSPLLHIQCFVERLQNDAGSSLAGENREDLTLISQAAKRMHDLIDDLLSFSRLGKSELQTTEVNLDQLVRETVSEFQADTQGRNVAWEIRPLPVVRADRALLRLALVNLISNAVKFTGKRAQARIEIGVMATGSDETVVAPRHANAPLRPHSDTPVIFIRDNGAGFDPRHAGKLFTAFQRLHRGEEFAGTGIGLANVQRIIHRHGGRVWAEGVLDGGATFYFSIPAP